MWKYVEPKSEPPFYMREARPNEIEGWDPLSGKIIAHSVEECRRLGSCATSKE
jgi:hypothetical protein